MVVPQRATLATKLSDERHRYFLARQPELESFSAALHAPDCALLFVSGPAGVGKTSLLQECQRIATEHGHSMRCIEADELTRPGHEALLANLGLWFETVGVRTQEPRPLLFIDGYERLSESDSWLLDRVVQELPSDTLLVLASRKAPPHRLLIDRAWAGLTRQLEIGPWKEEEAREFLELRGIPAPDQQAIQELAKGYPLVLAVAADVFRSDAQRGFGAEQVERVQTCLADALPLDVASRAQQLALDVSAISQTTSVELLDHVLKSSAIESASNAHELFGWLVQRPFVDRVGNNARPQLLARTTLQARLRRDQKYDALLWPIREFWVNQLGSGSTPEGGMRALFYLDRDVPFVRGHSTESSERAVFELAQPADHAQIVEFVRRHDGDESAELCRAHLRIDSHSFEITRAGAAVDRVLQSMRLLTASDVKLAERDPASRLVKQFMHAHPPDKGASVVFVRWLMAETGYQSPSPRVFALMARGAQIVMGTRVTYALGVYRDPEEWHELWEAAGARRAVVGRFKVGTQTYSLLAFSYTEGSLRDLLLDAGRPQTATRQVVSHSEDDQRRKIKQRVTDLARNTKLTTREAEILELLCLGSAPEEIAQQLQIRPRTVKFHQENVLRKTGAATRIELFRRLI